MHQYLDLLKDVVNGGVWKKNRTSIEAKSVFGRQLRFELSDGFPILTTKNLHLKSIIHELLWFISGDTNIGYLNDNNVSIWDEWADEKGELGPIYGYQWRCWPAANNKTIDQLIQAQHLLRTDPDNRRIIVSAWNTADVPKMALPPCHCLFQFYVSSGKLSCQLYQRSADAFLGLPFNIASYALLTMMMAQSCNLLPGQLIHTLGDVHLYANHVEHAKLQLTRVPRQLPRMLINKSISDITKFSSTDFSLTNYNPHPHIRAEVVV